MVVSSSLTWSVLDVLYVLGLKTEASGEISLTVSTEQLLWLQKEVIMS